MIVLKVNERDEQREKMMTKKKKEVRGVEKEESKERRTKTILCV